MNFSEKLIRLRKREGISQEELASYLEVSRQAVSRWEYPASACCCLEFSRRYFRRNIWSRPQ